MSEIISLSLIELLFWYRDLVKNEGRAEANKQMHKTCPLSKDIWFCVEHSVDDSGQWINGESEIISLESLEQPEEKKEIEEEVKEKEV